MPESFRRTKEKLANARLRLPGIRLPCAHDQSTCGGYKVYLQYNPQRAVSSGAAVDAESIKNRPCFLCKDNLPGEQQGILYRNQYLILCNPAPIFEKHFTIVALQHEPQEIAKSINWLLQLSADMSLLIILSFTTARPAERLLPIICTFR